MTQQYNFISWNVNGIRAAEKKGFVDWVLATDAHVIALQETKAHPEQLSPNLLQIPGYQCHWKSGERKGYSGVGIYHKLQPLQTLDTFVEPILNNEGRLIGLELEKFYFFDLYAPNGGQGIERVQYKLQFYKAFYEYITKLPKPVIFCGDINTAHQEIDLARPSENRNTSGFMDIEREWLHFITKQGYIDTFRHFHPGEANRYSWWDMKTRARERNVGWRIDYFFASPELQPNLINADILHENLGSDHAPITLQINI